jgi:hypothetical protein
LVSLGITALLGIASLIGGDLGETEGRILGSTVAIAAFSGTGLAAAVRLDRRAYNWVGIAGIATSVIAALLSVIGIWSDDLGEDFVRPWATFALSGVVLGYGSLILLIRPRHPAASVLLVGTLVCLGLAWAVMMVLVWLDQPGGGGEALGRFLGALGILTVFGTLGAPILNRVLQR